MPKKIKKKETFKQKIEREKQESAAYRRGKLQTSEETFRNVVDNMTRKACEAARESGKDFSEEAFRRKFRLIGLDAARRGLLKGEDGVTVLGTGDIVGGILV